MSELIEAALSKGVVFLLGEQRALVEELKSAIRDAPLPAELTTVERIGWFLSAFPTERSGDYVGELRVAILMVAFIARQSRASAGEVIMATVEHIASASSRFRFEQEIASISTHH